jgi:hypothetical protein
VVAYLLPKQVVVGSNPITRSDEGARSVQLRAFFFLLMVWL